MKNKMEFYEIKRWVQKYEPSILIEKEELDENY